MENKWRIKTKQSGPKDLLFNDEQRLTRELQDTKSRIVGLPTREIQHHRICIQMIRKDKFGICDILPKIQLETVNSTSVFLPKYRLITNSASTQAH